MTCSSQFKMKQRGYQTAIELAKNGYVPQPTNGFSWEQAPVAIYWHNNENQMNQFFDFVKKYVSNGDHIIFDSKLNGSFERTRSYLQGSGLNCAFAYQKDTADIPDRVKQSLKERISGIIHIPIVTSVYDVSDIKKINSIDDFACTVNFDPVKVKKYSFV